MSAKVTAILLAAGRSSRMGQAKGLLDYLGRYWIEEQVKRLHRLGIRKVLLGIGYGHEKYQTALSDWIKKLHTEGIDVQLVRNYVPEKGPFSTIQSCLQKVVPGDYVLIQPIDCPLSTSPELVDMISSAQSAVACYNGRRGHPVFVQSTIWPSFLDISNGDADARLDVQIKKREQHFNFLEIDDPQVRMNLNTPEDWSAYIQERKKLA